MMDFEKEGLTPFALPKEEGKADAVVWMDDAGNIRGATIFGGGSKA
jgi:hypothetical protein